MAGVPALLFALTIIANYTPAGPGPDRPAILQFGLLRTCHVRADTRTFIDADVEWNQAPKAMRHRIQRVVPV
jgi:hypothetical protein